MTKKHFIAAAEIVRATLEHSTLEATAQADGFVRLAQQFNPRFDLVRFYTACGLVY